MTKAIRIATRNSKLAIAQANIVSTLLVGLGYKTILVPLVTTGDKMQAVNLATVGGKGLFLKEVQEAVLRNQADIAVHSMKDMPAFQCEGLTITAVLPREDPRDALIANKSGAIGLIDLPKNSVIGTSSARRKAIIASLRDDLIVVNSRGNINTRLLKLSHNEVDATILAIAGLKRLGLESAASHVFGVDDFLPAVAQGVIAIEARKSDLDLQQKLQPLNCEETSIAVIAERSFMREFSGDCTTPIAAYAVVENDKVILNARYYDEYNKCYSSIIKVHKSDSMNAGTLAAEHIKSQLS